jgi:putative transposase
VSNVIGYIKGKSAIVQFYVGRRNNFTAQNFMARGYFVSTVPMKMHFAATSRNRKSR